MEMALFSHLKKKKCFGLAGLFRWDTIIWKMLHLTPNCFKHDYVAAPSLRHLPNTFVCISCECVINNKQSEIIEFPQEGLIEYFFPFSSALGITLHFSGWLMKPAPFRQKTESPLPPCCHMRLSQCKITHSCLKQSSTV